jgi:adenylate kinase family enzyme
MQRPFLIIELVGPAGAGKTTLSRVLTHRNPMIQIGSDIELRKTKYIPVILRNTVSLLPIFLKLIRNGRHFTWEEIKYLIYLAGWPEVLRQEAADGATAILLDHGPVFKLATLNEFGPKTLKTDQFANWWDRMFKQWASTLDMVIWLDAPDTILDKRINSRDQRHSVKGKGESEVVHFLARYRTSYEETLAKLRIAGATRLLQFDTSRTSIEQVADEILSALNRSV